MSYSNFSNNQILLQLNAINKPFLIFQAILSFAEQYVQPVRIPLSDQKHHCGNHKYAHQYKDNRSYHIGYKKAKNPDTYFHRYERQIILYGGARRMLEQSGINIKSLNVDKLKAEYQELMKQKSELTSTYKDCEKEVHELKRKQENLNQYLGKDMPTT